MGNGAGAAQKNLWVQGNKTPVWITHIDTYFVCARSYYVKNRQEQSDLLTVIRSKIQNFIGKDMVISA